MKKIVVIGTGRMGGAFATAFAKRTSHKVSIWGSHAGSSSAAALSHQLGVRVADDKELLAANAIFVATPPGALYDVATVLKGLRWHHRCGDGPQRRRLRTEARRRYKRGRATCAPRSER